MLQHLFTRNRLFKNNIKSISTGLITGCLVFSACKNADNKGYFKTGQIGRIKNFCSSFPSRNSCWQTNKYSRLDSETFSQLLQNKIPAIRVKNFLSREQALSLSQNIENINFSFYENVYPPIGRIGITQFEYSQKNKIDYFKQVSNASNIRDKIFTSAGIDVLKKLKDTLITLGYNTDIAYESEGVKYFCGLIRDMGGAADLHFDYAPYDAPEWNIGKLTNQIAWNVYVKLPEQGGETIVYDKFWQSKIFEKFLSDNNTGSYGFKKELVEDSRHLRIRPSVGDLWFFNSRNFHEVLSSNGKKRLSISSFIGQVEDQKNLFLWS